jgi:hypothetical protein
VAQLGMILVGLSDEVDSDRSIELVYYSRRRE